MNCIDCTEFPQEPGTAFIVPGKCKAGLITTGSAMEACERFDLIKNEAAPRTLIGDLRRLINQWRADVDQKLSITSAALNRCSDDLEALIRSWERGEYGKG